MLGTQVKTKRKPGKKKPEARGKRPVAVRDEGFRVVDPGDVPMEELFWPEMLLDWRAISEAIAGGQAVCIKGIERREEEHYTRCAVSACGAVNMCVESCFVGGAEQSSYDLWLLPRTMIPKANLPQDYARTYE